MSGANQTGHQKETMTSIWNLFKENKMFKLKTLSKEAIPKALAKAEHYRLLNEPLEAESICLDILEVEPDNQQALVTLLLALTDKFKHQLNPAFTQAQEVLGRLGDRYCEAYFGGIMYERRAKVHLDRGVPGAGEKALTTCSPGDQDAILRWNTCARILMQNPDVVPPQKEAGEQMLE
jgi:hypothetical protein